MRRSVIALAAAACLATAACTNTTDPATSPPAAPSSPAGATTSPTEPQVQEESTPSSGGTQSETTDSETTDSGTTDSGATAEDVDLADQDFQVTAQQAIDSAVSEAGGGFVHSIELDWSRHHSAWVYEVDVLDGNIDHDFDIHADTGEVLEHEQDDTDDQEQAIDLDSPMKWETARDKALGAVQGRVTSWKLEYDDDYTSYEFDIEDSSGDEIEVEVNVDTGNVTIDD